MKFPQFRVRTLLLLKAIMGVLFVACAKWPVTETVFSLNAKSGASVLFTTDIKRNPTFSEWAILDRIARLAIPPPQIAEHSARAYRAT